MLSVIYTVNFIYATRLADRPCLIQAKDTFTIWLKGIKVKSSEFPDGKKLGAMISCLAKLRMF